MRKTGIRFAFSLIELLIVLMLVACVLGALGFHIPKALKKKALDNASQQVQAKIYLAEELMLDYQADVSLRLVLDERENQLNLILAIEKPLPEKIKKTMARHGTIKGVSDLSFDGVYTKEVELQFDATLGKTSRGVLKLENGMYSISLILKGYPSQILEGEYLNEEKTPSYPEEILSAI